MGVNEELVKRFGEQRYLRYGEGDTFTKNQIAVSYRHKKTWQGEIPQGKSENFKGILAKLKNKEKADILFFGDSIMAGCDASGTDYGANIPPYMPDFPTLIAEYLKRKYKTEINCINTSVGGMNTRWGLENLKERVLDYSPDIVFIGFGMNDPATDRNVYKDMIKQMIDKIHETLPETEIMLVSSIMPSNESSAEWFANQRLFYMDLLELEKEYSFVGTANITSVHKSILDAGKRYRDITANNINHPNDYIIRLYAQVILTTLLGDEFNL